MSKRVLITGASGFIGSHLLSALNSGGHEAHGPELDLHSFDSIAKALKSESWDLIIHLAGVSHVPTCEQDPGTTYRTNLGGTALLLEGMRRFSPDAALIFSSTAQVYKAPQAHEVDSVIISEDRAILPQNTYARSKWLGELIIQDEVGRRGLKAITLRLFNHTHKTQAPEFFLPHIYDQLKGGAPGTELKIPVGNLDVYRDIGSVSDLISAFEAAIRLLEKTGAAGPFNICSGRAKHLRSLAEGMALRLEKKAEFVEDPSRIRKGEPRKICGSHESFARATGWAPKAVSEEELLSSFFVQG